ncbi:MAG: mechanosensitive ion channel [Cyanobacteria bacterium SBC]|nr:mechanosensitive ion channel [Cyanobacteria bacterium SBC]
MLKRLIVLGFLMLGLLGFTTPVLAQMQTDGRETAPVVLDGRFVLEVSSSGNFSAEERADRANQILQNTVTESPHTVRIVTLNGSTTLRLNDVHLLTVTEGDIMPGIEIEEQARAWKRSIETALERAERERTPEYVRRSIQTAIRILVIAAVVQIALFLLQRGLLRRQHRPSISAIQRKRQQVLRLLLNSLQNVLWLGVAYFVTGLFPVTRSVRYRVVSTFTEPIIPFGDRYCSILDLLLLLAAIVALWVLVGWFANWFKSQILQIADDRNVRDALGVLVRAGLTFIGILAILQSWGIDIASLAVLASAVGVGVGFGLQNIANNFISGIIIAFNRPIQVGDFIQIGDLVGTVERIGSRSTELVTLDQLSIIVPNSRFLEQEIVNWSHGNPVSRFRVPVGVAYGSKVPLVRKALLEAARSHPEILRYPAPQVWFQEFGDSSLNFDLFVWIREPQKQFKYRSELNYRIHASLAKYRIEIPFPQRDLHLKSPKLDRAVSAWIDRSGLTDLDVDGETPSTLETIDFDRAESLLDFSDDRCDLESLDLDDLARKMRGSDGVEIKNRRFGLRTYPNAFVGTDAVEWLMRTQKASLKVAIQLGQLLIDRGIIHHVHDEHDFKNERLFYRFYKDES